MTAGPQVEALLGQKYRHGFVTDIESDSLPPGLDESVVTAISRKKGEPQFLLDWRLSAYRHWLTMKEPAWARVHYKAIDYQDISYYSAPKAPANAPKSLDEVDPKHPAARTRASRGCRRGCGLR
jgi:Fe-S cluster assembly protein SufB